MELDFENWPSNTGSDGQYGSFCFGEEHLLHVILVKAGIAAKIYMGRLFGDLLGLGKALPVNEPYGLVFVHAQYDLASPDLRRREKQILGQKAKLPAFCVLLLPFCAVFPSCLI